REAVGQQVLAVEVDDDDRDVFNLLGGYEERFFLYYEDVDLAFRALLMGYEALVVPSARVVHRLGATTRSMARLRFYVARNSTWCAVRCLPSLSAPVLARRWLAELRSHRPRRFAAAEVAGRLAGLARLPRTLSERRAIQRRRVVGPAEVDAVVRAPVMP
ncbi:MAG TPA: hypothetical protein VNT54_18125, partial [Solirubrobacteraceae bacterium]|nr:hypothetical protein [Solirubrobacteraceae bacterium]